MRLARYTHIGIICTRCLNELGSAIIEEEYFPMSDNIQERITNIVVDLLGVDASDVTVEAHFRDDLEADSLDLVELIMAFEEEFGGEISDEDAQKINTVGDAISYIQNQNG
jgi:acyl carrier protein